MLPNTVVTVPDGYSRLKVIPKVTVRVMTLAEVLTYPRSVQFVSNHGTLRNATVNGKPKTWKTRPSDVDLPCKYGMYEYGTFEMRNGEWVGAAYPVIAVK